MILDCPWEVREAVQSLLARPNSTPIFPFIENMEFHAGEEWLDKHNTDHKYTEAAFVEGRWTLEPAYIKLHAVSTVDPYSVRCRSLNWRHHGDTNRLTTVGFVVAFECDVAMCGIPASECFENRWLCYTHYARAAAPEEIVAALAADNFVEVAEPDPDRERLHALNNPEFLEYDDLNRAYHIGDRIWFPETFLRRSGLTLDDIVALGMRGQALYDMLASLRG